jgi:hypothetical protein
MCNFTGEKYEGKATAVVSSSSLILLERQAYKFFILFGL